MALQAVWCHFNKQTNYLVSPFRSVVKCLLLPVLSHKVSALLEEWALLSLTWPTRRQTQLCHCTSSRAALSGTANSPADPGTEGRSLQGSAVALGWWISHKRLSQPRTLHMWCHHPHLTPAPSNLPALKQGEAVIGLQYLHHVLGKVSKVYWWELYNPHPKAAFSVLPFYRLPHSVSLHYLCACAAYPLPLVCCSVLVSDFEQEMRADITLNIHKEMSAQMRQYRGKDGGGLSINHLWPWGMNRGHIILSNTILITWCESSL